MAKTPKYCIKLIEEYETHRKNVHEILRDKRCCPIENQADWIKEKSEDYYIGMLYGIANVLESMLFDAKCYNGFSYVKEDGTHYSVEDVQSGNYCEWSRSYGIK